MPVSVLTDIVTWLEMIAQIGVTTIELGVLSYLVFDNGWLDFLRMVFFWLDGIIIKYIDQFYSYFEKILSGQIFSPTIVDNVMKNVYVFVALFVLLKLLMLFMKYLANPEMVSDDKVGMHSLVKRVIFGMCGMLMLPTIFNFSINLQKAILNDNLFGKILLDKQQLKEYEKNKHQMGRMLAFNVLQAFWNMNSSKVTDSKLKTEYKNALSVFDPGVINDINVKFGSDYAYDYFPIASTVVLVYVLYLIVKYCIDVVVRMFKLFLLQMIGPLAISDYMINGDSKETFKNWLKTTISVYAMLFVRIFSIWFIAFIMILMQGKCTHFEVHPDTGEPTEVCADQSLLYIKPGAEPDYLLKGIITLGLLALLMEFPKFLSDVLGLDLEQDASVKSIMQKAGNAAKGVGMAGLAVGGAAIGGAISGAKNMAAAGKNMAAGFRQNKGKYMEALKADPKTASKLNDMQSKKAAMKGLKGDEKKQAKADYKAAKKDLNAAKKGTQASKDYKLANSRTIAKGGTQMGVAARGGTSGIISGVMSQVPGLRSISQGENAANQDFNEASNNSAANDNIQGAYEQGANLSVNQIEMQKKSESNFTDAIAAGEQNEGQNDAEQQVMTSDNSNS